MRMDGQLLGGLENFEAVWRRVRGERAPTPPREDEAAAMLRGHMDALAASADYLAALAGRCRDAEIARLARAEGRRFRCLQLEYFLLTGRCHVPGGSCPCRGSAAQGLRTALLAARDTESGLRADAQRYPGEAGEALLAAAEGEAQSARALRALLQKRIVG